MTDKSVVFRFLNGFLQNCEFNLEHSETVFIVGHPDALEKHALGAISPDNVIVVPAYDAQESFRFSLSYKDGDEQTLLLKFYQDEEEVTRTIRFYEVVSVQSLNFAIRERDGKFSDDILSNSSAARPAEPVILTGESRGKQRMAAIIAVIIVVAGAGLLIATTWLNSVSRQTREVTSLLETRMGHYSVLHDQQRNTHILTASDEAAVWAKQVIARSMLHFDVTVATLDEEQQRVARWINKTWPEIAFHRINMDNPQYPVIELSSERNSLTEADEKEFKKQLHAVIPYAMEIDLSFIRDALVSQLAEAGLRKTSVGYSRIDNESGILFLIQGNLDDSALDNLKSFIRYFSSVWGEQYIQFAIEMQDDTLNKRSFKFGAHNYIKVSPGHWFFSDNK